MPGEIRRFLFSDADLEVLSFSGMEGISQLYQFELDLVALSPNVAFDRLLNKSARLTIRGPDSTVRDVHGVVSRFEMLGTISQRTLYRAILTPPHFKLTLRRRLRVFQDLTTQQIVTQVLQEGGIGAGSLSWTLKETYKPRNYCVQYRESDMDFVARLLEEEGIAYHFQHTPSELKTVFSDHQGVFQPIPGKTNVVFNTTGLASGEELVSRFSFGQQLRSGAVYLRDYNFRKSRVPVEGKAQGADPLLEVYDYPGEFVEAELGQRLATVRLQQQELDRLSGLGSTTCMRMSPGCRFTLGGALEGEQYPRKELNNKEYLLTTVTHSGHQPQVLGEEGPTGAVTYSNTIAVVPSTTPFRPARVTPRPNVLGTHAARVVGPPGAELHVDPYGRVKVRFHWEREQKNTAWVRVAADYAGAGFGNLFPPRVGQEVLVDFLEGDPDRPVVTGRVYNGEQVVPGTLPGGKTGSSIRTNSSPPTSGADVSTGLLDGFKVNEGYNELRFEDSKESEELGIHAQKDYNVVVENDRTTLVKRDRKETVKRDQKELVERHRTLNVKLDSLHTARTTLLQSADKLTLMVGDGSTGTSIEMTPTSMTFSATTIESSAASINDIRGGKVSLGGQGEEQAVEQLTSALGLRGLGFGSASLKTWAVDPMKEHKDAVQKNLPGELFVDGPSMDDVNQGQIGDCYLMCSLAAVAQKRPDLIEGMFQQVPGDPGSPPRYQVKFHDEKGWLWWKEPAMSTTTVDNVVPYHDLLEGSHVGQEIYVPLYGRSNTSGETWVSLAEKGYAQTFGGGDGYEGIGNGGLPDMVLERLTGGKSDTDVLMFNKEETWKKLKEAQDKGYPVAAGSVPFEIALSDDSPVVTRHCYTVTGVSVEEGTRVVHLRNPWGSCLLDDPSGKFSMPFDQFYDDFNMVTYNKPPPPKSR